MSGRMRRLHDAACLALLLGMLGGCVDSGGVKPQVSAIDPQSLAPGTALAQTRADAQWPQAQWWRAWRDPQLDQLVRLALADNPGLQIARSRVNQASAQAEVAGAGVQPQVGLEGAINRQRFARYANPSPPGGYNVWNNSAAVQLSYALDFWGRQRSLRQGALDRVQAAAADAQFAEVALQAAVVRAYVEVALQYALLDSAQAVDQQRRRTQQIVRQRRRAGLASQLQLSQAAALAADSAALIERARQQLALAQHQLAALVGKGPGFAEQLVRPQLQLPMPVELPARLPLDLLGHRADMVAARWQVQAASHGIAVARASFYPDIDLVAAASLASAAPFGGFFNLLDRQGAGGKLGLALSLPLFDGGARRGQYGVAVADYDQAVAAYNQQLLGAVREVADQVVALRTLAEQQQRIEQGAAADQRASQLAEQGYRAGITEFVDVLQAQQQLLLRRQQMLQVQADRLDAWIGLMQALGGGYQANPPALPQEAADAP